MNPQQEMETKLNEQAIKFLSSTMEKIEAAMTNGFSQVNARLDLMADNYIKREELDRTLTPYDQKVKALEDNQKWVVRLIIGIVVTALLGIIIAAKTNLI